MCQVSLLVNNNIISNKNNNNNNNNNNTNSSSRISSKSLVKVGAPVQIRMSDDPSAAMDRYRILGLPVGTVGTMGMITDRPM